MRRVNRRNFILLIIVFLLLLIVKTLFFSRRSCREISLFDVRRDDFQIPRRIHFITGQGDASEDELDRWGPRLAQRRMERAENDFHLINFLVVLAAEKFLRPREIFLHFAIEPTTFWWKKLFEMSELKIVRHKIPIRTSIFRHRLVHHAHRTDLARLDVLDEFGGVYLDLDLLVLRSFEHLFNNDEQVEAIFAWESQTFRALSNALIIAPMKSKFLRRIKDSYQSFNSSCWACHSVLLTGQLATIYSDEVQILPSKDFFRPSWSHIDELYVYNQYDFRQNYAVHLWNSYVGKIFLQNLTLNEILQPKRMTTFIRMIHHAIGEKTLKKLLLFKSI